MLKFFRKIKQILVIKNPFLLYLIFTIGIVLIIPLRGNAKQKGESQNNNNELIIAAKEIIQNAKTCALITIDDQGRPRVRTMDPFPPEDDLTVWFGTNSSSRKVTQIKENSKVTLYYTDSDDRGYVMIHGIASIVNDITEKEKHWKVKWKDFYPNYPDDYMLIKVLPQWMEVISETRGILGDEKTWLPPIVTLSNN